MVKGDAIFEFQTYGGFTPPGEAKQLLRIEPGKMTYYTYNALGEKTREIIKPLTQEQYDDVVRAFEQHDFLSLNDSYKDTGGVVVMDAGVAEITMINSEQRKTVVIDPYVTEYLPYSVFVIAGKMQSMIALAREMNGKETEQIAEKWIMTAPTYARDGSRLELKDHVVRKSYPPQHLLLYGFESATAGYGRGGKEALPGGMRHKIEVVIEERTVISAIVDDRWDELNQIPLEVKTVKLRFQPMQCVDTLWEAWYKEGRIRFVRAPTEQELLLFYYAHEYAIEILDYQRVESGKATCQACRVCPTSSYLLVTVREHDVEQMKADGWKRA